MWNISGLNPLIKSQGWSDWLKKAGPSYMLLTQKPLQIQTDKWIKVQKIKIYIPC